MFAYTVEAIYGEPITVLLINGSSKSFNYPCCCFNSHHFLQETEFADDSTARVRKKQISREIRHKVRTATFSWTGRNVNTFGNNFIPVTNLLQKCKNRLQYSFRSKLNIAIAGVCLHKICLLAQVFRSTYVYDPVFVVFCFYVRAFYFIYSLIHQFMCLVLRCSLFDTLIYVDTWNISVQSKKRIIV